MDSSVLLDLILALHCRVIKDLAVPGLLGDRRDDVALLSEQAVGHQSADEIEVQKSHEVEGVVGEESLPNGSVLSR